MFFKKYRVIIFIFQQYKLNFHRNNTNRVREKIVRDFSSQHQSLHIWQQQQHLWFHKRLLQRFHPMSCNGILGLGLGLQGCPQVLGFLGDVNFLRPITKVIDMPKTSLKCIGANPRTGARWGEKSKKRVFDDFSETFLRISWQKIIKVKKASLQPFEYARGLQVLLSSHSRSIY